MIKIKLILVYAEFRIEFLPLFFLATRQWNQVLLLLFNEVIAVPIIRCKAGLVLFLHPRHQPTKWHSSLLFETSMIVEMCCFSLIFPNLILLQQQDSLLRWNQGRVKWKDYAAFVVCVKIVLQDKTAPTASVADLLSTLYKATTESHSIPCPLPSTTAFRDGWRGWFGNGVPLCVLIRAIL